ncbi:hypothetical protein DPMN_043569 [Dreissena polymorpha]|uniref:Uncharacterized protein n=1 Tax=Dreissena polymorpha TaxID=45954 RepID=A0A9D4D0S2_DREPO|nr:hypothetical protein DPMN_043569 [Dreissena polymorpha]
MFNMDMDVFGFFGQSSTTIRNALEPIDIDSVSMESLQKRSQCLKYPEQIQHNEKRRQKSS